MSHELDRIKALSINEDVTLCPMCKNNYDDPHSLPCLHNFCKGCLADSVTIGKIECPLCDRIHLVPNGNLERVIKPSNMTKFLVKFKKNNFDKTVISEGEKVEQDGIW